jgi:hypothetical protein
MASKLTRTTTDHEEIQRWAEERGAEPAEVGRTERDGETGVIRLDFPGYSGARSLKRISWDEWFRKFDDSGLALVYQERTAGGQRSNFNKLVARVTATARARGERRASRGGKGRRGTARTSARGTATRRTARRTTRRSPRRATAGSREAPRAAVARQRRGGTPRSPRRGGSRTSTRTQARRRGGSSRGRGRGR